MTTQSRTAPAGDRGRSTPAGDRGRSTPGGATWSPGSARWRWTRFGAIWLIFLANAASAALSPDRPLHQRFIGATALVAYAAAYLVLPPVVVRRPLGDPRRTAAVAVVLAGAAGLVAYLGEPALSTFVFSAVVAVLLLRERAAIAVCVGIVVVAATLESVVPGWTDDPVNVALQIGVASFAMFGVTRLIRRNQELAEAREEIGQLAVAEERARFSRDLHDILGHSLTVITVKSELARKLVARDPGRAEAELADIERLSREALADVRATVSGYREVSLPGELAAARAALDAAGVRADLPTAADEVSGPVRELFGYVVREGVTNVVRHAGASWCAVRLTPGSIDVVDDGPDAPAAAGAQGHGLRGLAERVAAAGGVMRAGRAPGGGFVLHVEVPTS